MSATMLSQPEMISQFDVDASMNDRYRTLVYIFVRSHYNCFLCQL